MEPIALHSMRRATDEAIKLWALASAQYPKHHAQILDAVTAAIIEATSSFALNARRALEILPGDEKFTLSQPRWKWVPSNNGEVVSDLWDALNRIIHAQKLVVGFEELPHDMAVIAEGAFVVPYIQAETDRKEIGIR